MNFKKNGGFTLVELIVVIAILGILAGIGIPQYSKYVEKASIAVDNQNLNMLHNVFVVSCVEHGVNPGTVSVDTIDFDGTTFRGITQVSGASAAYYGRRSGGTGEDKNTLIMNSFNGYIGSEGIQFKSKDMTADKIIKGIEEGVATEGGSSGITITPDENGNFKLSYGDGGEITLNVNDLAKLNASTFITSENLGAEGLLNKVNEVTGFAAALSGTDIMSGILGSTGFQQMAAEALGLENPDMATFDAKFNEVAGQMLAENPDKYADLNAAKDQLRANCAVLYAAKNASSMNKSDITSMLSAENAGSNLLTNLKSDPAGTMANASLAYGMYTAYAYSTGDATLIANTSDYANMATYLNDKDFRDWVSTEQGQADMDAYLSSLNMINSSAKNEGAVSELMMNGFNDPELINLLNQSLQSVANN